MLKMREVASNTEDFAEGKAFIRVMGETNKDIQPSKVRKVVFCSG